MKLPLTYLKTEPNEYVRISTNGKVKKEGFGQSGIIFPYKHSVQIVKTSQVDAPFGFREMTDDNQELTLQGSILYAVSDGAKLFDHFDFSVDPRTKTYLQDSASLISDTLINIVQTNARELVQGEKLEDLLTMSKDISLALNSSLIDNADMEAMGINVTSFYINSIKGSSEIMNALGAEYREGLLTKEAEAAFERRAEAVKQEKAIAENELANKISLEEQTANLISLEAANAIERGKYTAEALRENLKVYESMSPEMLKSYALIKLGENANSLDSLMLPSDVFGNLLKK